MGLRSTPSVLLKQAVTLTVPKSLDRHGNVLNADVYTIKKVNVQATNEVRKTQENTEVVLRSLLIIDCKASNPPHLDIEALQRQAEGNGLYMTATIEGKTYTVLTVDAVDDVPATNIHHYELGLV